MNKIACLEQICQQNQNLELAFLVGSQATGKATDLSDWDIALQWVRGMDFIHQLAETETLRNQIAKSFEVTDSRVDLIDIPSSGLAMREQVANDGMILKGDNTLALSHFLNRTWRELEEFYWDKIYAA